MKRLWPIVAQINALEPEMQKLSDAELRAKTEELRQRVRESIQRASPNDVDEDRKSTRLNSSHLVISYAVFCLKKKKTSSPKTYWSSTPQDRSSASLPSFVHLQITVLLIQSSSSTSRLCMCVCMFDSISRVASS